jgi:hypothetical protein
MQAFIVFVWRPDSSVRLSTGEDKILHAGLSNKQTCLTIRPFYGQRTLLLLTADSDLRSVHITANFEALAQMVDMLNIGPGEIRKRRLFGVVALAMGIGTAIVLIAYPAPRWSRAIVFLPIWIAGLGLFQAREKT